MDTQAVLAVAQHCPSLEHVELSSCYRVTDASVSHLAAACPNLSGLLLSALPDLTDAALSVCARACPHMYESLSLLLHIRRALLARWALCVRCLPVAAHHSFRAWLARLQFASGREPLLAHHGRFADHADGGAGDPSTTRQVQLGSPPIDSIRSRALARRPCCP